MASAGDPTPLPLLKNAGSRLPKVATSTRINHSSSDLIKSSREFGKDNANRIINFCSSAANGVDLNSGDNVVACILIRWAFVGGSGSSSLSWGIKLSGVKYPTIHLIMFATSG